MEREQELEWKKAQEIAINVDLVDAARRQLEFLAAVDRNRWLYDGPALDVAIYRYNVYWLPLLAKHSDSPFFDGPLVVPLDCEWIWHCHRLNPVRYKSDCEELYGSILDNHNVVSTVEGICKTETEKIWMSLYSDMPYELDFTKAHTNPASGKTTGVVKCTNYDLLSAVKRQSTFFYQVARPHMSNELFLEGAVARYKGFLHLIKRNRERSIKSFCVPTYDIDLIWHTHQLHPASYCRDLLEIMDKVLEHDDTDSDRTKGKKLDVGFSGTTKQWEEMYGIRYWRAGSMHKGNAPSPLRTTPYPSLNMTKKDFGSKENQKIVHPPETEVVEVMLEFVGVKNLPEGHKGGLFVSFTKTQPDTIFNAKRSLTVFSESGEKQVACFMCEPTGDLSFELMCYSVSSLLVSKPAKTMASGSVSLADLLSPTSNLTMEKWLEMLPSAKSGSCKPVYLRVAISVTVPASAPYVLHMIRSRPFSKNSCFFPLPRRIHLLKHWTSINYDNGNEIISLQMRDSKNSKGKNDAMSTKEVIGIVKSGETNMFAKFTGKEWLLIGSRWSLKLPGTVNKDGQLLELIGDHSVKFFPGRKLEYEPKHCDVQRSNEFLTGIEFSLDYPYGKAVALLDLKSGIIKVNEAWLLFPGLLLAFILGETMKKQGYNSITTSGKTLAGKEFSDEEGSRCHMAGSKTIPTTVQEERKLDLHFSQGNAVMPVKGGACSGSGGCGSGCGNKISKEGVDAVAYGGGCGGSGGCGSGGGNKISQGLSVAAACGSGCGSGCGNKISKGCSINAGACGSGCGSSCRNNINGQHTVDASACGGCGSGGCSSGGGNNLRGKHTVDAGACGGCGGSGGCGSGCGNNVSGQHAVTAGAGGGCGGSGGCGSGCGNNISNVHRG